ncbi:MAG: hypothetical protein FJ280_19725 [Planctomycetes bacterium]|uniref:Outer membrane protein beta-barrel domain-containing protein n=1 Tax=Eiseniibacteriota bacterium TaxID=2212470 RepID=A0A937XAY6_UNCEI|nr:hypothetical protein [Candidatus Eisenbacteria bacterium]MBM4027608.1 hypothetical protein [Planctomycetota bacterium]
MGLMRIVRLGALVVTALAGCAAGAAGGLAGVHANLADLTGEFGRNAGQDGIGLSGEGWLPFSAASPVAVGLRCGYLNYGFERESVPFVPSVPGVWVYIDRYNNLLFAQLLLRLQARGGAVRPYGEVLCGLNHLFTRTSVRSEWAFEEIASSQNWDDTAFVWGGGVGTLIRVHQSGRSAVLIDIGGTGVQGGHARYLAKGGMTVEEGILYYDVQHTRTHFVLWRLGVMFEFH